MIFMAIQVPNPGTGNGATGDNEFVLWTKVKDNFSNTTHAASRLVGTATGQVPLAQDIFRAAFETEVGTSYYGSKGDNKSCDDLPVGSWELVGHTTTITNLPPNISGGTYGNTWAIHTQMGIVPNYTIQTAWNCAGTTHKVYSRKKYGTTWYPWAQMAESADTYQTTTASGANVVVDTAGKLMRSTSSERYKNIIADLTLDDVAYANAMQLAPIVYRSTAEADDPTYHYYSFSAEKLGAFDPAFTLWRDTEMVTDADGNTTEQPLAERVAEGININALLAFSHAIAIKQDKLIKALEARVAALEPSPTV